MSANEYNANSGFGTPPKWNYTPPPTTPTQPTPTADEKYKTENLQSWMSPEQFAEYQQLAAGLKPLLLSGETFDYYKYLTDPGYAQLIEHQINRDPQRAAAKQAAFTEILDFFKRATTGGIAGQIPTVDVKGLFEPLKAGIEGYSNQALQEGKAEINRQSQGAEQRAAEGLAGTGLGRSGVAAGAFQGIQTQRTGAVERLLGRVQDYEQRAKMEVDRKIAETELQQKLYKQGLTAQEIQDTINFQRGLYTLQYKNLIDMSSEEQKSFWDSWGGLIGTGASVLGSLVGGPAAGAAVSTTWPGGVL